ncbi:MAG: HD domain-containing protein [Oscillospiraceae bacterium]|nr:HD domain-containing protein [Oscillospiraceae bacterium]
MTENIRKTLDFVKAGFDSCPYFADNPADGQYRFEHSLRVAHIGAEIARREGLDKEALTLACLLHDIAYSREIPAGGWNEHGRVGARIARPFLESLGLNPETVNDICYGIAIHVDDAADFDGERTSLALSVSDADNIDRFGTFRIYDAMRFAGFYEMSFEEKLAWTRKRIPDLERLRGIDFATVSAKAMWLKNLDYQIEFYTRLLHQLEQSTLPEEF